eukprot:13826115-Alexandrium_andersonii.AAC.1
MSFEPNRSAEPGTMETEPTEPSTPPASAEALRSPPKATSQRMRRRGVRDVHMATQGSPTSP